MIFDQVYSEFQTQEKKLLANFPKALIKVITDNVEVEQIEVTWR